jgi:ribosomal protein L27
VLAGKNVSIGKDHTLFAAKPGIVSFTTKSTKGFDGKPMVKKVAHVTAK